MDLAEIKRKALDTLKHDIRERVSLRSVDSRLWTGDNNFDGNFLWRCCLTIGCWVSSLYRLPVWPSKMWQIKLFIEMRQITRN